MTFSSECDRIIPREALNFDIIVYYSIDIIMDRRTFLMRIGASMIGCLVVRPLRLNQVWIPTDKQKQFFLSESDIVAIELERILPKITMLYERDDAFYKMIKSRKAVPYLQGKMTINLNNGVNN